MGKVQITEQSLATSAARNRTELIQQPVLALGPALSYMSLRTGIRYSETVGELSGDIEIGPYNEDRVDDGDVAINPRTLYTFFGSVVKRFSPNSVAQSIYGANIVKGDGLKNVDITLQVLAFLAAKIGRGLAMHLFNAVRNDKGDKTVDLFNGYDTIALKEITGGGLSVDKGNLYKFSEAITRDNAHDMIVDFCRAADDELLGYEDGSDSKGGQLNLLIPRWLLYAYRDDYKNVTGHTPIYDKFNQTVVEGFENIRLVPFSGKQKSNIIQLTTRKNMLVGVNQTGDEESLIIEKHHEFKLSLIAALFFGVEYESISKESILVGQLAGTSAGGGDAAGEIAGGGDGQSDGNV